jgi:hypothetical protein
MDLTAFGCLNVSYRPAWLKAVLSWIPVCLPETTIPYILSRANFAPCIDCNRGHRVLVVSTSPAAHGYLRRAAARHTSNTTAEAMQHVTAEPSASQQHVAPEAAPAAAGGGQQQQQQQQVQAPQPAAASHKQQTWKGELQALPGTLGVPAVHSSIAL